MTNIKTVIISLLIFQLFISGSFGQNDTVKLMFLGNKKTSNEKLIKFAHKLSLLSDPCDHIRSLKAFEQYKEIFNNAKESIKDTALLMFIRFHRAGYDYFDCPDSKPYKDFYGEYDQVLESLLEEENKKLNKYGRNLAVLSHNDIFSLYLPGFTENLFENHVRKEIQLFLKIYSLKQSMLYNYCSSEDCTDYINTEKEIVLLSEKYLKKYTFMRKKVNTEYYRHLINFCLGEIYYIDGYERGYGRDFHEFHIYNNKLNNIYTEFITEKTNSKTTWFINQLLKAKKSLTETKRNELILFLIEKSCFEEEDDSECTCNKNLFTFDGFQINVKEIINCIAQ
jgi:hypothetical protein